MCIRDRSDRYLTDKEKEHRAVVQEAERQLPLLDFQCGNAAFAFRNLLCGRVGRGFDAFDFFGKDVYKRQHQHTEP